MNSPTQPVLHLGNAGIRPGEISILMATRGRPEMLAEELSTLKANTVQKDKTAIWIYVDDDDDVTQQAIKSGNIPDPQMRLHWHIGPRVGALGQTHQAATQSSHRWEIPTNGNGSMESRKCLPPGRTGCLEPF